VDLRNRTMLLCGALALAIAASILLRGRRREVHLLFAGVATDMGLWYLAQSLYGLFQASIWARVTAVLAILLPQFTLHFFEAIVPRRDGTKSTLVRFAGLVAVPLLVFALSPQHGSSIVRVAIFLYAFGLLAAGLWSLAVRGQKSGSRATQRRVSFLVVIGALAASFSLADFLWFIGAELPPVGAVLSIVFLFLLAESLRRERLLDLYEMVGRLMVSTALAFLLAGIFYVFVTYLGRFNTIYLNAVLSAIVILVLFEPMRTWVERQIHRVFFRERVDLENSIADARRQLVHVLEVEELRQVVLTALEKSRHVTSAALYLLDKVGTAFDLAGGLGPDVPQRIELASARPLLDLATRGPVVLEEIVREVDEQRARGDLGDPAQGEAVLASAAVLGPLREGVVIGIKAESGELAGLLVIADDRVRDAYSYEDLTLLATLAAQIGVVIQNSLLYQRMQERDRLAAIGTMAARLAHEVKNPLGAIKGAAQLLAEPSPGVADIDPSSREFLGIILEEVDRLDRVVGSVLDYARPTKANPAPVDLNGVVRRTVQILSSGPDEVVIELDLSEDLARIRVDAEQLRQVLMNLVRNATQAMNGRGKVVVGTRARPATSATGNGWVELAVTDSGPGISQKVLKNLFVPFYTTKNQGTGLGLAISQRLVQSAGGAIEVKTHEGAGTTFTVVLPASDDPLVPSTSETEAAQVVSETSLPLVRV
jgi:two-component system, NtrC family, sensor histidine kinase HydH